MNHRVVLSAQARQWIVERTLAGASREQLIGELVAAGWHKAAARDAVQQTQQESAKARVALAAQAPTRRVPEPDLATQPLWLDAGDRRVRVLLALRHPRVVVFGDLLSAQECAALIAAAQPRLARSETVNRDTGTMQVDPVRTSAGMFFQRAESELTLRIEQRIAKLLYWPAENGEGLQVLHYLPGAEYEPHYDYFDPSDKGTPVLFKRGGQRVATLIMYLNTPECGGATRFTDIGLEVMPQQGNAVFFSYAEPSPASKTMHAGAPVTRGEKWIATKWLRERFFG